MPSRQYRFTLTGTLTVDDVTLKAALTELVNDQLQDQLREQGLEAQDLATAVDLELTVQDRALSMMSDLPPEALVMAWLERVVPQALGQALPGAVLTDDSVDVTPARNA